MAFTRSKYGIANYAAFNRARVTVYIEGKKPGEGRAPKTYDELYYRALFSCVLPDVSVVFVVLGSRRDVGDYAEKIEREGISNAVTIMDLDHDVLSPVIIYKSGIHTYGYSWENEFWTKKTCLQALKMLSPTAPNPAELESEVSSFIDASSHALAKLSKIDIVCKVHGEAYLPGDKPGLEFKPAKRSGIGTDSIRVIRKRIPQAVVHLASCDLCQGVLSKVRKQSYAKVVQGHRWEHFCLHRIASLLRATTNETHKHESIKAAAFSSFLNESASLIDRGALEYYQRVIPEVIDFSLRK